MLDTRHGLCESTTRHGIPADHRSGCYTPGRLPGLPLYYFGQFLIAFNGKTDHPEVRERFERAFALAVKHKIDIKIHLFETDPQDIRESVKRWNRLGARIFNCMTDRRVLSIGYKETCTALTAIRED